MNAQALAENYVAESRAELATCLERVRHCMGQLDDGQIWSRPHASMNSIGNLLLHLSGNLRQRFGSLIGGAPDDRDRAREFAERGPILKATLLARLEEAMGGADAVLAGLTADRLLEGRRYQGLKGELHGTVQAVVLRTMLHLSGHVQEIVYATRLLCGDGYRARGEATRAAVLAADDVVFGQGLLPEHAPRAAGAPTDAPRRASGPSPLSDPLLELEQEFQDQEEKGKI